MLTSRNLYTLLVFLILFVCYSFFVPTDNWAVASRTIPVYALVDDGVLNIDTYHVMTGDKAFFEGHYYTDKSIGPSLLALPFYAVYKFLATTPAFASNQPPDALHPALSEPYRLGALEFITLFVVMIPSAFLGAVFFRFATRFSRRDLYAFILALVYGLATIAFTYSRVLFQHQTATLGIFVGFFLLWKVIYEGANTRWLWAVGALFSLAAVTEYAVALFAGLIFLWALYKLPNRRLVYKVILGALPLLLISSLYNYAVFRSLLPVGYANSVWASTVHDIGIMGLSTPSLRVLGEISFGTFRGLFFISPVLLLALPGLVLMWRERPQYRDVVWLISLIIVGFFIYNAAYIVWWGGWSTGPRFLVPMLPLMTLPIIFVFNRWLHTKLGILIIGLLISASTLNVWIQSIAHLGLSPDIIYVPDDIAVGSTESPEHIASLAAYTKQAIENGDYITNPLVDYAIPAIQNNNITLNIGNQYGLTGLSAFSILLTRLAAVITLVLLLWAFARPHPSKPTPL